MKAGMVCQVLILVLVFSISSIFALNTDIVRSSEVTAGISSDIKSISEKYVNGDFSTDSEYYAALEHVLSSYEENGRNVNIYVLYANQDQKIADVFVEYQYKQFNGTDCTKTIRETVIKDQSNGGTAASCRSISKEFFKTEDGASFVPEDKGGLIEDSVWKTGTLSNILSTYLNYERDANGNWPSVQYSN